MNKETNKNIKIKQFKLENFKPEELQKLEIRLPQSHWL